MGRLASQHDFKSNETCSLKVDLFSAGGQVLKFQKQIYISDDQGQNWSLVSIESEPKSLGASWGQQKRVVLEFSKNLAIIQKYLNSPGAVFWIGLDREILKSELKEGEFLVWEYLGAQVKESARPNIRAVVVEIVDPYEKLRQESLQKSQKLPPVTLVIKQENGKTIEVPSSWAERFDAVEKVLWFDDLSPWENLNSDEF